MVPPNAPNENTLGRDFEEVDVEVGHKELPEKEEPIQNLTFSERLRHFTYAWFACTMSTGGEKLCLLST
ncbi:hypothetical protein BofuT4_P030110.1 [Botrytis cinerea T4]|uniref:Uncharacterized protein n=1 Tax=Botryotinia fuckeliana (strain T4) TaxID=999810 RepID=G2Y959_BOTF4|nr:hypothetical protein BofuT4_P030110.1 [Botrytis cinerea T4]